MGSSHLFSAFKRSLNNIPLQIWRPVSSNSSPLFFRSTPYLLAEPLKKKKRIDPGVIKAREERKRKRLEKQIRRLEKNSQQLKPIDECEIPVSILNEKDARVRKAPPISKEVINERTLAVKVWTAYKNKRHMQDVMMIDRVLWSQQLALDQLLLESPELYQSAIQIDETLVPFTATGPVETPPIEKFDSPDGEYTDASKKWDD